MRAMFASAEIVPLAKTGGLADVSASLPRALAELDVDIRLVMPGYIQALDSARSKQSAFSLGDILGAGETMVIPARLPASGLPIWLIDCPSLFRRSGGLYSDGDGRDWDDNALRFAVFSHAVARLTSTGPEENWRPDIVHVNDWHLGLVPGLLAQLGSSAASILTIHNLAFQGIFPAEVFPRLGLPDGWFSADAIEFYGQISLMKAGIRFARLLTTVSPSYAQEILTPEFGCGLDGLLRERAADLVGITNGIDVDAWNPADSFIVPFPYNAGDLSGKRQCKAAVQAEFGLDSDPEAPLIAFISRLTEQKMADLIPDILPVVVQAGAQLVVSGEGQRGLETAIQAIQRQHPGRIAVRIGYDEARTRKLLAAADILAAPSRFEPCGLVQMYAMRFGTIPVAREVGGIRDTVMGHSECAKLNNATGFLFSEPTADAFGSALQAACRTYCSPVTWRAIQRRAMKQNFGWGLGAKRYLSLYRRLSSSGQAVAPRHRATPQPLRAVGA